MSPAASKASFVGYIEIYPTNEKKKREIKEQEKKKIKTSNNATRETDKEIRGTPLSPRDVQRSDGDSPAHLSALSKGVSMLRCC